MTAKRISRPRVAESASHTIGLSRLSKTSFVNSFGAATNAVSPTMPSGRVKVTKARCCGVSAPDDKDSKVRAQTSLRSRSSISLLESKFAVGE